MAIQSINSASLSQFTDLINRDFVYKLEHLPQVMKNSMIVVDDMMPMHTGEFKRFAERLHMDQYASRRDEGDIAEQAEIQYGYEKDLQVHTVSKSVSITKRMRVAGKNQEILDSMTRLTETIPNTIDLDLSHRLTFAFDTSYTDRDGNTIDTTTGDGVALCSAAHTLTGSATTYTNVITGNPSFSKASLEVAERQFVEETYNNLGEKDYMMADCIITTDDPTTCNQVKELLGSMTGATTVYGDGAAQEIREGIMNVYKGQYKHLKVPRLATTARGARDISKRNYWFLSSSMDSSFYYSELEAPYLKTPMDGNNGEEFSSENWNYLAAGTYGITIVDGRWIKGSTGQG